MISQTSASTRYNLSLRHIFALRITYLHNSIELHMLWLKRITFSLLALIFLIFLAIWIASPSVSRWILGDALAPLGLKLDADSSIRLNPFSSVIYIQSTSLDRADTKPLEIETLKVGYSLSRLVLSELHIDYVIIENLSLDAELEGDHIRVAGFDLNQNKSTNTEQPESNHSDTESVSSLALSVPEIRIRDLLININNNGETHALTIKHLDIENSFYSANEASSSLKGVLSIDNADLDLKLKLEQSGEQTGLIGSLKLDSLLLENYAYLTKSQLNTLEGAFSLDLDINVSYQNQTLNIEKNAVHVLIEDLKAGTEGFEAVVKELALGIDNINAQSNQNVPINLELAPALTVDGVLVKTVDSGETVLSLARLEHEAASLSIIKDDINATAPSLTLKELKFSDTQKDQAEQVTNIPALFSLEDITVQALRFSGDASRNKLTLGAIELGKGSINVLIDQNKVISTLVDLGGQAEATAVPDPADTPEEKASVEQKQLAEDTAAAPATTEQTASGEPAFYFAVDSIEFVEPMAVYIRDESVSPKFDHKYNVTELSLGKIDSENTELETPIKFAAEDGKYFASTLTATARPFTEHVNAKFELDLKEFSLPEVNPYVSSILDMEFKTGQLDASLSGEVAESQLDALANIKMRATDFSASQAPADESNLIGQTAIPLNVALGMLKDKKGNIELKIPVDGDIEDPSFGVRYLLGLVAKKAAMNQAKNYLMTTFVPYAQVVKVAMSAGSFALKVRFEDLPYSERQTDPEQSQLEFVTQLTQLMADKPALHVKVCPVVTGKELNTNKEQVTPEIQEQAFALGKQRAESFKSAVVASGLVESSRLLICQSKMDFGDKAVPSIKFSI